MNLLSGEPKGESQRERGRERTYPVFNLSGERGRTWSVLFCEQRGSIDCDTSFITLNTLEQRHNDIATAHTAVQASGVLLQHTWNNLVYPPST